ncbi:helix-turn-helix transcriptional regulator [Phenylobacterium sp.]|uniref:helix-turn-helix transcriptional regulator n=1 Tax=Phenylobacterium sp. TaxID=1871053 RepID=UPI003564DDAD
MDALLPTPLERIIEGAYAAVYEPDLWREVVADYVDAMGAEMGALHAPPTDGVAQGAIFFSHNIDPTPVLDKIHIYGQLAPHADRAIAMGLVPGVFLHHEVIPYEELHATDYYREYARPMKAEHGMQCMFRVSDRNIRSTISMNVARSDAYPPFDESHKRAAQVVFPHLRRAVSLVLDVSPQRMLDRAIRDAFDAFDTPCCLMGADANVVFANAAARQELESGQALRVGRDRLGAVHRPSERYLQVAVARACDVSAPWSARSPSEVVLPRLDGDLAVLVVVPLGHENPFLNYGPVRAAAYIVDGSVRGATRTELRRIRNVFGLTPAEAEVTAALIAGRSVAQIAEQRGASAHTIKTQMKVIYEKTQSNRQVDLARLQRLFAVRT